MELLESLEDLVYRSPLAEGTRALRGASHWVSIPATLAICGVFAAGAVLLARQAQARRAVIQSGGRIMDLDITQIREKFRPPLPAYPPLAKSARIQGDVVVQIVVGRDGVPLSAHALEGPLQLRAAAEACAMAWRFEPFLQNGVPLVSRFSLTVSYRMK